MSLFLLESNGFSVEGATNSRILVAVKKTNRRDAYPTLGTVYFELNQNKEELCTLSYKNRTHDICKIFTDRWATKFTVRFRACRSRGDCANYSHWQTVWTLPPSKQTPQFIKINSLRARAKNFLNGSSLEKIVVNF